MTTAAAFDPVAAFAALKAHLPLDQYQFVSHVLRSYPERCGELMGERGGEEVSAEEFAQYCLQIAKRVHREVAS